MVPDSSYFTFSALIYYLYTDLVDFAPLTSSFLPAHLSSSSPFSEQDEGRSVARAMYEAHERRKALIWDYAGENQDKPMPVSPKSMYRLADKMQLHELKQRAQEDIAKKLTVHNIVWEVFSGFTAQYPEIRKIETDFLLRNWAQVKKSPAMKNIFAHGATHPGLSEVWPHLLSRLEYKAPESGEESDSAREDSD